MPDAVVQGLSTLMRALEDAGAFILLLGFVIATFTGSATIRATGPCLPSGTIGRRLHASS